MKSKILGLFLVGLLAGSMMAHASPVPFDIDFGVDGAGTFTIDSSLLAGIPASGLYFGPIGSVDSFSATVTGILFDTFSSGSETFAASNGQISGVTGITNTTFSSSGTPGAFLVLNTCDGIPCVSSVQTLTGNIGVAYSVRPVATIPEPATLTLLGIGLAGLGYSRRK